MHSDLAALLDRIADRQAIAANLARHSRGIDRRDPALLASVYHPDATVAYGMFEGPAADFAALVGDPLRAGPVTLHRPCNQWIRLDGDRAVSECYVVAYREMDLPAGRRQSLIGGRYLDRHERRGGVWKLAHRTYVLDWNTNRPPTGTADPAFAPGPFIRGGHGAADPGNRLLARWRAEADAARAQGEPPMQDAAALARKAADVLARQDIHDLIMAQARATDRGDEALLRSLWHPGATVDVGVFAGAAEAYCGMIIGATAGLTRMFHSVANDLIEVDGDGAVSESYVIAFTTTPGEDGATDEFVGGRYLDRFARRGGVWKFVHRSFVMDWTVRQPSSDCSEEGMYALLRTRGGKYPNDPLYAFWPTPG
jgi:hypothetical protein